jgi:hypothetical protein
MSSREKLDIFTAISMPLIVCTRKKNSTTVPKDVKLLNYEIWVSQNYFCNLKLNLSREDISMRKKVLVSITDLGQQIEKSNIYDSFARDEEKDLEN